VAEAVVLVCDTCGRPAAETITIKVGRSNWQKDLCDAHVAELVAGARKPRPGRRRATVAAAAAPAKRRGRPPGSKNRAKSPNGRRRGRPPKAATAAAATPAAE
jgi:hypothetical protein